MKCPNCDAVLVQGKRDGVEMEICPSCQGMWITRQEMVQLEDEVFDFGDDEKGSLMFGSEPSTRKCPELGATTPPSTFIRVDLPAPFSPIRPTTSPGRTARLTPSNAVTPG